MSGADDGERGSLDAGVSGDRPTTAPRPRARALRGRTRRERLTAKAASGGHQRIEDHAGQIADQLRVRAVLAQLSPADQEVLRLIEWEGLHVAEAALVLRCTRTAFGYSIRDDGDGHTTTAVPAVVRTMPSCMAIPTPPRR